VNWDRIAGMLIGLAIGDALGNTSESLVPADRRRIHGEIRDYLPNRHADGRRVGLPSDDTHLAFRTLELLLEKQGLRPERLAARFGSGRRIFGIGSTVRAFAREWARSRPPRTLRASRSWPCCGMRFGRSHRCRRTSG
jgi:ADP-ribosyl-[dinitrogen reductase] hydrolase